MPPLPKLLTKSYASKPLSPCPTVFPFLLNTLRLHPYLRLQAHPEPLRYNTFKHIIPYKCHTLKAHDLILNAYNFAPTLRLVPYNAVSLSTFQYQSEEYKFIKYPIILPSSSRWTKFNKHHRSREERSHLLSDVRRGD